MASDPNDVNKVGPGITFDKIDANDAIAACQQDLRVNPNTARFKFQLARALHKAKRYEEAARLYKSLASSGYAKAAENLAHLYEHGLGVPTDFLVAYVGYRLAVQAGYDYALIELGDLSRRIASEKIESDDFTNKHIEAEFLRDHRDIIKPVVIIRDEQDILAEAAHWYEQAIKKGVPSGILRLAKLHLEADPIRYSSAAYSLKHPFKTPEFKDPSKTPEARSYPRFQQFVGSAVEAAKLYRQAASNGSVAAQINLAYLYEVGHGVEKDLAQSRRLFSGALGTIFDGPARIGLLSNSYAALWKQEWEKWRQLLLTADRSKRDIGPNDIVFEASGSTKILVTDPIGSRIFSGSFETGQTYHVPSHRNDLILWSRSLMSRTKPPGILKLGNKQIAIPIGMGIRLDRELLRKGVDAYSVKENGFRTYPRTLPQSEFERSRIRIESILMPGNSSIYVHSDDDVIGFYPDPYELSFEMHVPNVKGLVLDLRADENKQAALSILLDGKKVFDLTAGPGCKVTLRLDPDRLVRSRKIELTGQGCVGWKTTDAPRTFVVDVAGNGFGYIQKLEDESVPPFLVPGPLHMGQGMAMLSLQLGGRWEEALRAANIFTN